MEKILSIVIPLSSSTSTTIQVRDFTYAASRMGKAPTITAQFKYQTLIENWYSTPYAEFNNRRFYLKGTPNSSYSNEEVMYKYDATFVADDSLERTYFIDAVGENDNSYCSNNTKVQFFGDLSVFVDRLNAVLGKVGLGDDYWACIDSSTVTAAAFPKSVADVLISFEDKYIYDVLTDDCYNAFDVPFFLDGNYSSYNSRPSGFTGTVICFSEKNGEIVTPFEYGVDKSLLSINRDNANAEIVNRCSGYGSTENLPWYYPNETSTGHHEYTESTDIGSPVTDIDYEKLSQLCDLFWPSTRLNVVQTESDTYGVELLDVVSIMTLVVGNTTIGSSTQNSRIVSRTWEVNGHEGETSTITVEYKFYAPPAAVIPFLIGDSAVIDYGSQAYHFTNRLALKIDNTSVTPSDYISTWSTEARADYELNTPDDGVAHRYTIIAEYDSARALSRSKSTVVASFHIELFEAYLEEPYFNIVQVDDEQQVVFSKSVLISESGVKFEEVADLNTGDYVDITGDRDSWVQPQPRLMPKIFRGRSYPSPHWDVDPWTERFYNAVNNTYTKPSGGYYTFDNPYSESNKHEHFETFDDIKPSIKGMMNGYGQYLDRFADIAFDDEDFDQYTYNDSNEKVYEHPYFFVKLRQFNGDNGFNLFDHALDSDTMKINMTSGICGGCTFEIMVDETSKKNPVAVDDSGNLIRDDKGNVRLWSSVSDIQDRQNNTADYSVWIALKKDVDTYGTIMPSVRDGYGVLTSDTFVITGINLPHSYILAAEKRLEDAIIKYMYENNSEKFKFSIDFSRIYFEGTAGQAVLPQLKEGAKIGIKYPLGAQTPITTYVTGVNYQMSKDSPLPKISVDLSDEVVVPKQFQKLIRKTVHTAIESNNEEVEKLARRAQGARVQYGQGSITMDMLDSTLVAILSSMGGGSLGSLNFSEMEAYEPTDACGLYNLYSETDTFIKGAVSIDKREESGAPVLFMNVVGMVSLSSGLVVPSSDGYIRTYIRKYSGSAWGSWAFVSEVSNEAASAGNFTFGRNVFVNGGKITFGSAGGSYIELKNIAGQGETPSYAFHSNIPFYSDSWVASGGISSNGGGGGGGSINIIPFAEAVSLTPADENETDAASAYSVAALNNLINALSSTISSRKIWGQTFNGNISGNMTGVGTINGHSLDGSVANSNTGFVTGGTVYSYLVANYLSTASAASTYATIASLSGYVQNTELLPLDNAIAENSSRICDVEAWMVKPVASEAYIGELGTQAINLGGIDLWNEGSTAFIGGSLSVGGTATLSGALILTGALTSNPASNPQKITFGTNAAYGYIEVIDLGSGNNPRYALHSTLPFYSESWIASGGINGNSGGGGGDYDLKTWQDIQNKTGISADTENEYVPTAWAAWNIYNDLQTTKGNVSTLQNTVAGIQSSLPSYATIAMVNGKLLDYALNTDLIPLENAIAANKASVNDILSWMVSPSAASAMFGEIGTNSINLGGIDIWNDGEVANIGGSLRLDGSSRRIYLGKKTENNVTTEYYIEFDAVNKAIHTNAAFYADSWVASGGIGSHQGGGAATMLGFLSDVLGDEDGNVTREDGDEKQDGDVLTWNEESSHWVASENEGDKNMAYTARQDSASDRWTIFHNMGKAPSVTVVDSSGRQFFGDVVYGMQSGDGFNAQGDPVPTGNPLQVLTVLFAGALSGVAYLN